VEKKMSDLVPISVEYNITVTAHGKQTYSVSAEIGVSELPDIIRVIQIYSDSVIKDLKAGGNAKLSMVPTLHREV
jgi:hypothetical protein